MTNEAAAPVDDYLLTDYVIIHDGVEIAVRIDEASTALNQLLTEVGAISGVFITGWNPLSEAQPPAVNAAANEQMASELEGRGIRVLPHIGRSSVSDWFEEGFFALDLDPDEALAIARAFRQHAVVHAPVHSPAVLLLTDLET